jgi:HAMP domain-containing protein
VACVVAPVGYWKLAPLETGQLPVLAVYLALALAVAVLVLVIRRWLRPPAAVLENTFIDVTSGGISRDTPTSRTLLLASPEVGRASLYWYDSELMRVVLHTDSRDVEVHGLDDMAGFVNDLRTTFVRLICTDVRLG